MRVTIRRTSTGVATGVHPAIVAQTSPVDTAPVNAPRLTQQFWTVVEDVDLTILAFPPCFADTKRDGLVASAMIATFVAAWEQCGLWLHYSIHIALHNHVREDVTSRSHRGGCSRCELLPIQESRVLAG